MYVIMARYAKYAQSNMQISGLMDVYEIPCAIGPLTRLSCATDVVRFALVWFCFWFVVHALQLQKSITKFNHRQPIDD